MGGSVGLLLISSSILILLGLTFTTAEPEYLKSICYDTGNFTANSGYRANLNSLLSSMSSNATVINGFYNGTSGQDSDQVYGIFLCRVGVASDMCRDCISNSARRILQECPDQKEAIIWYVECMLRYSNRSIFATMEDRPGYLWSNPSVVPEGEKSDFFQALGNLLNRLVIMAVSGPRPLFAAGDANYTSPKVVSGLVQCTPDISRRDCKRCLQSAVSDVPICCYGQIAGGIQSPSCTLRYTPGPFYDSTALAPLPPPPPPSPATSTTSPPSNATITGGKGWSSSQITIISISVPTVIIVLILLTVIWLFLQRRTPKEKVFDATFVEDVDVSRSAEFLQFDFDTIRASTNGFSDANELGEGGFGTVYKGVLSNGQEIAVKRLSKDSGQGEVEFKNEVVFLAKLFHKNLVGLLGFCLEGREKLLIYEFMPNASLDHFIFDPVRRAQLGWEKRFKIIDGIIRGLLYLHEDSRFKIIHRDLKASNILLDQDLNPKISDFGMARLFEVEHTQQNTDKIAGTLGYMAPEYVRNGKFSVKSDVFSFGVLLLEIVSGKKNNSFTTSENHENLLTYAWIKWREGRASELIDPTLGDNYSRSEVMRCIHIGLLCVQESVAERPTMAVVVFMLNSDSFSLPLPSQSAFYLHSETDSTMPPWEYNSQANDSHSPSVVFSINEASISELYPR